jgi:glyoxylase-like metal-dependent hydrolase (beta-lactamase superfamily II)
MEWKVGDVKITKVVEIEPVVPLNGLLSDPPADAVNRYPWLVPDFMADADNVRLSIHALVVDTGDRRILVDTCVGENREGLVLPVEPGAFMNGLKVAGYEIEDIDTVLCTHLHFDHVGWNTQLVGGTWVPTFPHARYLFGRVEWDHWQVTTGDYINVNDTVRPVVDAGLADLVETDHVVCDQVRLVPTPGHTPGHVSVVIESGGERAVITGDMTHHPIQFAEPELGMDADSDRAKAAATRRTFAAERAADGALVIGTHFAGRTAGHIVADGETWRFDP